MDDISYILVITVGKGRWSFDDLIDLVGVLRIDPGCWTSPIRLHSLSKEEAASCHSILTEYYGAEIRQEVQRGIYK